MPTDLDLHCLLKQGMSCSAREGLSNMFDIPSYLIDIKMIDYSFVGFLHIYKAIKRSS